MTDEDAELLAFIKAPLFKGLNGSIIAYPQYPGDQRRIYEACERLEAEGHLERIVNPDYESVIFRIPE
jgi:hypothetical protein